MKEKHNREKLWGIILLIDILLSWAIFYICDMWLCDVFGPDFVIYENWSGDLNDPEKYRFGIGSVEILIALLQAILFVCVEIMLYKKKKVSKVYTGIAISIHILNLLFWVLFYIEWNEWMSIPKFLLPQYLTQKMLDLL